MKPSGLSIAIALAFAAQAAAQQAAILPIAEAQRLTFKHPTPKYPDEAKRRHITGAGVFEIHVDASSGIVTDVVAAQSTGSAILDTAAIDALKRWLFRPNTVVRVKVPIAFAFH